jgi:hypothetical protein
MIRLTRMIQLTLPIDRVFRPERFCRFEEIRILEGYANEVIELIVLTVSGLDTDIRSRLDFHFEFPELIDFASQLLDSRYVNTNIS